jgi:AcrR family transcriptional regulator
VASPAPWIGETCDMSSGTRPPGRREQKKADKLERILFAATKLFAEQGYAATTTTQVARAAGIGTGSLFLYVPSKEHLLVAVFRNQVDSAWSRAASSADLDAPFLEQAMHTFNGVLDFCEQAPELLNVYIKVMPFIAEPVRADIHVGIREHLNHITELVEGARRRGQLVRTVPSATLAVNLYAMFVYHMQRLVAGHVGSARCRADLRAAVELQLRGVTPRRRHDG